MEKCPAKQSLYYFKKVHDIIYNSGLLTFLHYTLIHVFNAYICSFNLS